MARVRRGILEALGDHDQRGIAEEAVQARDQALLGRLLLNVVPEGLLLFPSHAKRSDQARCQPPLGSEERRGLRRFRGEELSGAAPAAPGRGYSLGHGAEKLVPRHGVFVLALIRLRGCLRGVLGFRGVGGEERPEDLG